MALSGSCPQRRGYGEEKGGNQPRRNPRIGGGGWRWEADDKQRGRGAVGRGIHGGSERKNGEAKHFG
ncbi:hypothetical protein E2562_032821 [Oryza meyeriana var. granulata]|uniref:Uncharacterized protein n=1 Tax=Oryza meyeriana var. granulata TaxID=110450 RepID=A0A6G1DR57_9ORYZ|nr:hypothetical protein E2562_032821 [Oryza meyeriana var. granulata]